MSKYKKIVSLIVVIFCVVAAVIIIKTGHSKNNVESIESATNISNNVKTTESEVNTPDNVETTEIEANILDEEESTPESATVKITKKVEASYEEWLAAGVVIGISMSYSNYEIEHIYLASNTEANNSKQSAGVYVLFLDGKKEILIQSKPLDEERSKSGTVDLHTQELGFSTFDEVDKDDVDFSLYREVTMDDLTELISQSILVSLYEH